MIRKREMLAKAKEIDNFDIIDLTLLEDIEVPKHNFFVSETLPPDNPKYTKPALNAHKRIKTLTDEIVKESLESDKSSDDGVIIVDKRMIERLKSIW